MLSAPCALRTLFQLCCLLLLPILPLAPAAADLIPASSTREISISLDAMSASGQMGSFADNESATHPDLFDQHVVHALVLDTIFGTTLASQQNSTFSPTTFSATGGAQTAASTTNPDSVGAFDAASTYSAVFGVDTPATYVISGSVSHAGSAFSDPAADLGRAFIQLSSGAGVLFSKEASVDSFVNFEVPISLSPGVAYTLTAGANSLAELGDAQTSSSSTSAFSFALVIPEPHTANLLAAGMLGLALWSRRRSH
ncbi:MAG: hypothetical protein AAEJ53_12570 [Myxococcota bacterium]